MPAWSEVWQLPAFIGAVCLLAISVTSIMMSRPDNEFDETLIIAVNHIDQARFDDGRKLIENLEDHTDQMTSQQLAAFHAVRADLFYGRQMSEGGDELANLSQVVNDYQAAQDLQLSLSAERTFRMADSLITLSRIPEALTYYDTLPTTESSKRHHLLKRLVERNLNLPDMNYDETYMLLSKLLEEPDLTSEDRVWAVAHRAELQIEQDFVNEAINGLLVTMQQLRSEGIDTFPELYVLLGRGYYELGEFEKATKHLKNAERQLPKADERRAEALLILGRIAHSRNDIESAFDQYDRVINEYPGTKPSLPALHGRAAVLGRMERYRDSLDDYTELVTQMVERRLRGYQDRRDLMPPTVLNGLLTWHDLLLERDMPEMALRFAKLGERLYEGREEVSVPLLSSLASTHFLLGDRVMNAAWTAAGGVGTPSDWREQDPEVILARLDAASKLEARMHYLSSGKYSRSLSQVLQVTDPDATADALWAASEGYDRGGDYEAAVESLQEFNRFSVNHPRLALGVYRLGRCYQALEDYQGAILQFRRLIDDPELQATPEGYMAYVPLARCYLADHDEHDPIEAERLLKLVIGETTAETTGTDEPLGPTAPEFRNALIELGQLYARAAEFPRLPDMTSSYYPRAIEKITEAVQRYPNDPRINHLNYELAHAYRLSAESLAADLKINRPNSEKRRLQRQWQDHLAQAVDNYQRAIDGFDEIKPFKRTALERESLKFAYFWKADSLFQLEDYDQAIATYALIVDRYRGEPTALVAQARIITSYAEQDQLDKARTAQNLARRMLAELPETAFEGGLLSAEAWEQWLDWAPVLDMGAKMEQ
ncbi:MAG: hypothetical protein D8M59_12355 [Planctomycetes bacterium]|nr:hypothetical protein [Planctomycetota bacterium]NOG53601.1 tetratricopeptide repeat protein [Planctomycetota bacterium]